MATSIRFAFFAGLLLPTSFSAEAENSLNTSFAQTGYTGVLRVPNASTLDFGEVSTAWHHEDNINFKTRYGIGAHNTILFGLGILPGVEFTVQNTYKRFDGDTGYGDASSDLSFSIKASTENWFPSSPLSVAVGMQDAGGIANYHDNTYGVASLTYSNIKISAGYGKSNKRNQMGINFLSGPFGGIEWQATDWLQLAGDYDGTGYNAGLKLFTPKGLLPFQAEASAKLQAYSNSATTNRDNRYVGIELRVPFRLSDSQQKYSRHHQIQTPRTELESYPTISSENIAAPKGMERIINTDVGELKTNIIKTTLSQYGFQFVREHHGDTVYSVAFENSTFNHNELDAIGVALGLISKYESGKFQVFLLNNKLPMLEVTGDGKTVREFLAGERASSELNYDTFNTLRKYRAVNWAKNEKELSFSAITPKINLSPSLLSTAGTEFGVFDYSLALATNLVVDIWPGGSLDIRHMTPVATSQDVRDYWWHPITPHERGIDRALFHQAFDLPYGIFSQFSVGKTYKDYHGVLNETQWQSPSGRHKFTLTTGSFSQEKTGKEATPLLRSYRFYAPELDWAIEVQNGEYWVGDAGYSIKSHHWFGDLRVTLEAHRSGEDYAGMNLSFPLTPRKEMKPKIVQITGIDQWQWGYHTKISGTDNRITQNAIWEPTLQHDIDRRYFNRDRLSPLYLKSHEGRMREAFMEFVAK
ncbi:hypothetical protein CS022_20645 [Veronia nyctiphanis]|uniref:Exopolysaccharide biosynthesis protein YbjH n=1 Tax=Veronia nyctiphanis TaxID=1278244 RepID=A0A4Q0YLF6_9GAMM|nr:YjbH domain-containing protein [Veronia nyctiphanis]RXJ71506.1 hypothetical protein CS022_20645 [Veronia nyctiphanis]